MRKSTIVVLSFLATVGFCFVLSCVYLYFSRTLARERSAIRDQRIVINELLACQYRNWQTSAMSLSSHRILDRSDGHEPTLQQILSGKKLLVYVDYKMCRPCVRRTLETVDSLYSCYRDKTVILVHTPGGQNISDLDLSEIQARIWMIRHPVLNNHNLVETPCLLLMENDKIIQACHAAKHTDMPIRIFKAITDDFFSSRMPKTLQEADE